MSLFDPDQSTGNISNTSLSYFLCVFSLLGIDTHKKKFRLLSKANYN